MTSVLCSFHKYLNMNILYRYSKKSNTSCNIASLYVLLDDDQDAQTMFKAKPTKIVGLEPLVVHRHEYGQTSQFCQIQRAHCNK